MGVIKEDWIKGLKEINQENSHQKKANALILIYKKIDFKAKIIT